MIGNKVKLGIIVGIAAGIIDIIPMLMMKLPLTADLSAFSLWVVVGFLTATSALKINSIIKGILVSYLTLLPTAFIIGQNNVMDLIPVCVMTLILGGLVGYFTER